MSSKRWFFLKDDKVHGPVEAREILSQIEKLRVPGVQFWAKGKPSWSGLSKVIDELNHESRQSAQPIKTEELWLCRDEKGETGPYTFQALIERLKSLKKLDKVFVAKTTEKRWDKVFAVEAIMEKLGINRRQNARVPFDGTLTFQDGSLRGQQAKISSLSQGGFGIANVRGLSIGEVFKGSFASSNFNPAVHFQAEVVSIHKDNSIGARFLHLSTEAQAQIIFYVNQFVSKHPETDFKKTA